MSVLEGLLAGIVAEPLEETRWLVLADWLEEFDDPRRAELLRLHRNLIATCCEPERHLNQRRFWQERLVTLLAAGVRPCVPQETILLPGDVSMTFAWCPPGAFLMGSHQPNWAKLHMIRPERERQVHLVTLTKGFYMGNYPVTQVQWKAIMGTEPSHFQGPNRPVENVSWDDTQVFCQKLTTHLNGRATIRLPTEAEWEYACRAGTTTEYHFGDRITTDQVNYNGRRTSDGSPKGANRQETTEVGTFPANAWGLHDVHGNVYEFCQDIYNRLFYITSAEKDPVYNNNEIGNRVSRGGSWNCHPDYCQAAFRNDTTPVARYHNVGFRACVYLHSIIS